MFEGFEVRDIEVGDGLSIHARVGGSGPPVLLLHGYPQTHVMWARVAADLAATHTVVAADLRGYGDSSKPAGDAVHKRYAKRAMAADQVDLMRALGFERFAVVGHDRGARVAHRMCLDHLDAVERVAVLDIVPTHRMFGTADREFGLAYYHWFFLAQPTDLPERMIGADPGSYLRHCLASWSADGDAFGGAALAAYERAFADPATVHASCEDYRAGATIDLDHDEADRVADRVVECPLLVLWGARGFVGGRYEVLEVWREYAADVTGHSLDCGHFLPEEKPGETVAALSDFLGATSS